MERPSTIESVECGDRTLTVRWGDGRLTRIHYLWLRDNCTCRQCGTTETGARVLRLIDIPEDVSPERAGVEDGALTIRWRPDGHRSRYEPDWLRQHFWSGESVANARRTWGAEISKNLTRRTCAEVRDSEEERLALVERIHRDGVALLSGVGPSREAFEEAAALIGSIRSYSYEAISDIFVEPEAPIAPTDPLAQRLAYSGAALSLHVDESFRGTQPGLVLFQCVEADTEGGGESVLVDGFRLSELLEDRMPDAFEVLSRIATTFRRRHEGFDYYTQTPVFTLDASGAVVRFCWAEKSAAPIRAPEHLIESIYAARRALLELIHDDSLQARIALRPGDLLIADNYRVMHGRTAYRGRRHLRHCHVDRDEMYSRYRMACHRRGRCPVDSV